MCVLPPCRWLASREAQVFLGFQALVKLESPPEGAVRPDYFQCIKPKDDGEACGKLIVNGASGSAPSALRKHDLTPSHASLAKICAKESEDTTPRFTQRDVTRAILEAGVAAAPFTRDGPIRTLLSKAGLGISHPTFRRLALDRSGGQGRWSY